MVIINQDNELINFDNIVRVATFVGEVEDTEIYTILAIEVNGKNCSNEKESTVEDAIQLGIYADENETKRSMQLLTDAIVTDKRIFQMPNSKLFSDDKPE